MMLTASTGKESGMGWKASTRLGGAIRLPRLPSMMRPTPSATSSSTRAGRRRRSSIPQAVQDWIGAVGAKTAYIAPDSAWENGDIMSFNLRLTDERLDGEILTSLREAQVVESWRRDDDTVRPHGSIDYKPPAARGLPASLCRITGPAIPASAANHAHGGAQADHDLTFSPDHQMGPITTSAV